MKQVLITGDVSVDHHIYKGIRSYPKSPETLGTTIQNSIGGVFLLYDMLKAVSQQCPETSIGITAGIKMPKIEDVTPARHGYATWKPYKRSNVQSVWCVDELLGYGAGDPLADNSLEITDDNKCTPDILVIDDAALGFRFQKELWPACIKSSDKKSTKKPEWIVLKMSYPVIQGDLWGHLSKFYADKLILVVSAEDLRRGEVLISRGSSWEKTVQDLVWEIESNPVLKALHSCAHLIVTFRSEGAFILSKPGTAGVQGRLVYNPGFLEGSWAANVNGDVIGYGVCLTAGIVGSFLLFDKLGLEIGAELGLTAIRELLQNGYGKVNDGFSDPKMGFPAELVGQRLAKYEDNAETDFSCVDIDISKVISTKDWSILSEHSGESTNPLYGIARGVARHGIKVIKSMPIGQFGKLLTADRNEIESLNGIRELIINYKARDPGKKPLSIGVFGPPGAGKSFGIKEIVKGIMEDCEILEYNLSQFETGPKTLVSLLHRVRDVVLQGKTPVVFWDEFDSQQLAWLQYLLAPMQDGCFLDGHQIHPLGKCIFVFAGGTASTMDDFTPADENSQSFTQFKHKKGPDFVSRLHGYLNVLGPNPRLKIDKSKDPDDLFFPIRRALLLRSMTGVFADKELKIDSGLLSAFLLIDKYKHGARSLEMIVKQTLGSGRHGLVRSNLPPREQIGIHVDYDKFCYLINRDTEFKSKAEILAPVIHDNFCTKFKNETYSKTKYVDLPLDIKDSNLAAALRITEIFALVGLKLVPASEKEKLSEKDVKAILKKNLEQLATAEHNGWVEQKLLNGWQFGERNDVLKRHPCLVAFYKLPESEKKKDRDAVLNYPNVVKKAGFAITFEKPEDSEK